MKRVGIFSGTFDPVHQGHIAFCLEAIHTCRLDEVVLLPERKPRGKDHVTDISQRVQQLREAIVPYPQLKLLALDADQFTVANTLPELQRRFEGAHLSLLLGSDVAHTFSYRWEGLDTLLATVDLIIGLRHSDTAERMTQIVKGLGQTYHIQVRYTLIQSPYATVSSSQIRQRAF